MAHEWTASVSAGALRWRRTWVPDEDRPLPGPTRGGGSNAGRSGPSTAGRVCEGWNQRSRLNMRYHYAALPWVLLGPRLAMVTLSYPAKWREVCPDGRTVKAHLKRFERRYSRRWGPLMGGWIVEYQPRVRRPEDERGAPHVHLYIGLPEGAELVREWDRYKKERVYKWWWALEAWYQIVGSEDRRHLGWGVHVRPCFWGQAELDARAGRINWQQVADYFWRESGKWGQKDPPLDYAFPGRPWGCLGAKWGFKPIVATGRLSEPIAWETMRIGRRLRAVQMQKAGVGRRNRAVVVESQASVMARLLTDRGKSRRVHGQHNGEMDGFTVYLSDAESVWGRLLPWAQTEVAAKLAALAQAPVGVRPPGRGRTASGGAIAVRSGGRRQPGCGCPTCAPDEVVCRRCRRRDRGPRRGRPVGYERWAWRNKRAWDHQREPAGWAAVVLDRGAA
jgi:hypothetical protein